MHTTTTTTNYHQLQLLLRLRLNSTVWYSMAILWPLLPVYYHHYYYYHHCYYKWTLPRQSRPSYERTYPSGHSQVNEPSELVHRPLRHAAPGPKHSLMSAHTHTHKHTVTWWSQLPIHTVYHHNVVLCIQFTTAACKNETATAAAAAAAAADDDDDNNVHRLLLTFSYKKLSYCRDSAHYITSVIQGHSRSIVSVPTNWKPVCHFLLVNNTNLHPIFHRFSVIKQCWSNFRFKMGHFYLVHSSQ